MTYDFKNKVALVTGASRGIGRQIALELAKKGAHVIALARTVGGLEELDDMAKSLDLEMTLMPFDLKRTEELANLGPLLADRFNRLDILVGNAAVLGPMTPMAHVKPKDWNEVMTVNVMVNQILLSTLDPLLRGSDAGRAVFVTSRAAEGNNPYRAVYGVSKAALNKMVVTYAAENKESTLKVSLFDPGIAATAMRAKVAPGEDASTLPTPQDVARSFIESFEQVRYQNGETIFAKSEALQKVS